MCILKNQAHFLRMAIGRKAHKLTTFPLTKREDYKFRLGYHLTLEEVTKVRQKAQARKAIAKKGYLNHFTIRSYTNTLNGEFLREGDNFPFFNFLEPCHIKEKGILVSVLKVFNHCQLLEKEAFIIVKDDKSTQD